MDAVNLVLRVVPAGISARSVWCTVARYYGRVQRGLRKLSLANYQFMQCNGTITGVIRSCKDTQ
jgi:hypothetical protein